MLNHGTVADRLRELREQFARGTLDLQSLERERVRLRHTLLRIEGAIAALEQLVEPTAPDPATAIEMESP